MSQVTKLGRAQIFIQENQPESGHNSGMAFMNLQTRRLQFRALSIQDLDFVIQLNRDPEVMKYLGGPEDNHEGLKSWLETGVPGFAMAEIIATGEPIGWFHLRPERQAPFDLELGYRLKRSAWGQGYCTEGSLALLDLARAQGAPRVIATTDIKNWASRRVMEKIGMVYTNDFLYNGTLPSVRYEIEFSPA
jgi:RimJ/RimL family protein N-acetyltransferase